MKAGDGATDFRGSELCVWRSFETSSDSECVKGTSPD
jgi:hypothetical protein